MLFFFFSRPQFYSKPRYERKRQSLNMNYFRLLILTVFKKRYSTFDRFYVCFARLRENNYGLGV